MQKLDHQTSKSFEGARDADRRADFDKNPLSGVNINLQLSSFIDWRIEKREQTLGKCQHPLMSFYSSSAEPGG